MRCSNHSQQTINDIVHPECTRDAGHGLPHLSFDNNGDVISWYDGPQDVEPKPMRPQLPQDPEGHLARSAYAIGGIVSGPVEILLAPDEDVLPLEGWPIQVPRGGIQYARSVRVIMSDLVLAQRTTGCNDGERIVAAALEVAQQFPAIWRSIINDTEES